MITLDQLEEFSLNFKIDKFTVFREYLQLVFLNTLYKEKESEQLYFKGGTCLHFLYGSPRFSEDLDFSTILSKEKIRNLLWRVIENVDKEIPGVNLIFVYSGKKSLRYKIKYQTREFKYPLSMRIDFSFEKSFLRPVVSRIKTKIPVSFFSFVVFLNKEEILAEKMRAFLIRGKGKDIFDLWYLLERKIPLKEQLLEKKLREVNLIFDKRVLLKKIENYSLKELRLDLSRFLPEYYRKIIPRIKKTIVQMVI